MSECGIRVFADEADEEYAAEVPEDPEATFGTSRGLSAGQVWGRPCPYGHGDETGRVARRTSNRACVECQAVRKRPPKGETPPKREKGVRGGGGLNPNAAKPHPSGQRCAKDGCKKRLTVAAVEGGSPFCSRVCAGYGGGTAAFGSLSRGHAVDGDVSDAELNALVS